MRERDERQRGGKEKEGLWRKRVKRKSEDAGLG